MTAQQWIFQFDRLFRREMNTRFNQELPAFILFVNVADWTAEQMIHRQRYKQKHYNRVAQLVLNDPAFAAKLPTGYKFTPTGNGNEIKIESAG